MRRYRLVTKRKFRTQPRSLSPERSAVLTPKREAIWLPVFLLRLANLGARPMISPKNRRLGMGYFVAPLAQ